MALPFGESHWDYIPDLVQNYIQDLAARSLHREQMKRVCQSIELYKKWRDKQRWLAEELSLYPYQEIFRLGPLFIESESAINV